VVAGERLQARRRQHGVGVYLVRQGDAVDYTVRAQSQDSYNIDVTGCRYAQFCKELGGPELGFLLVCSLDFPFAEGFGTDIKLTRTQTIMQGASHYDFRYRRQKD